MPSAKNMSRNSDNSCKIHCSNLAWSTTERTLANMLAAQGFSIISVHILRNTDGHSRGFGFVHFATPEDASRALATMNNHELDGRLLKVNPASRKASEHCLPGTNGSRRCLSKTSSNSSSTSSQMGSSPGTSPSSMDAPWSKTFLSPSEHPPMAAVGPRFNPLPQMAPYELYAGQHRNLEHDPALFGAYYMPVESAQPYMMPMIPYAMPSPSQMHQPGMEHSHFPQEAYFGTPYPANPPFITAYHFFQPTAPAPMAGGYVY